MSGDKFKIGRKLIAVGTVFALIVLTSCQQEMADQPRAETYEVNDFFDDGLSARAAVPGTVARGRLKDDEALFTGKLHAEWVPDIPFPIERAVVYHGRDRFGIFCAPCHDAAGTGRGIVVRRGYRQPPSFHIERLRQAPAGYLFDVITNGFGTMPAYAPQIPTRDRWAIVAYIRALQLSQHASVLDLPQVDVKRLQGHSS